MSIGYLITTVLLIAVICGIIYGLKWSLSNVQFGDDPKTQHISEIIVKVLIVICSVLLVYVVFETLIILISPLFEQMNAAFSIASSKIFTFLDNVIPYAVLGGIAAYWWKKKHSKPIITDGEKENSVEVEYAEQEAAELHDDLSELIFNAVVDTSENSPLIRPRDSASIETGRDKPYSMEGVMAVHQYSVDIDTPLDKASGELIMRELQRHTNQRGKRYPQLCREGRPPIIYDIKNNGNFIIVEVVLYSEKYKRKIEDRRKARIARQQRQGDIFDSDF